MHRCRFLYFTVILIFIASQASVSAASSYRCQILFQKQTRLAYEIAEADDIYDQLTQAALNAHVRISLNRRIDPKTVSRIFTNARALFELQGVKIRETIFDHERAFEIVAEQGVSRWNDIAHSMKAKHDTNMIFAPLTLMKEQSLGQFNVNMNRKYLLVSIESLYWGPAELTNAHEMRHSGFEARRSTSPTLFHTHSKIVESRLRPKLSSHAKVYQTEMTLEEVVTASQDLYMISRSLTKKDWGVARDEISEIMSRSRDVVSNAAAINNLLKSTLSQLSRNLVISSGSHPRSNRACLFLSTRSTICLQSLSASVLDARILIDGVSTLITFKSSFKNSAEVQDMLKGIQDDDPGAKAMARSLLMNVLESRTKNTDEMIASMYESLGKIAVGLNDNIPMMELAKLLALPRHQLGRWLTKDRSL